MNPVEVRSIWTCFRSDRPSLHGSSARSRSGRPNQAVQRTGASRFPQRQMERHRRLAPVADLVVRPHSHVMPQFTDIWNVTPETAHPKARQLLRDSIVWSYGDDDSPLGNDTGADTFASYLAFRATKPVASVHQFIRDELASSGQPIIEYVFGRLQARVITAGGTT